MDFTSLGLSAASGIIGAATGFIEMQEGKKIARRNPRPKLGNLVVDDYGNLLDMFEKQAQYGIDAGALNFVAGKNEDALAATLQSMLLAGGSPNAVGSAYSSFTDAMGELGVAENDKRWQKIAALAPITQQLADAKLQRFLYDVDAPYKDLAQTSAALQNAGLQQLMGSLDSLTGNAIKQQTGNNAYANDINRTNKQLNLKPPTAANNTGGGGYPMDDWEKMMQYYGG